MQYLLMCCFEEKRWDAIAQSERDGVMQQYGELIQGLTQSGQYLAGGKLKSSAAATTVREKNGKPVITDGPFAETKEQLGGYHLIEAKDLDEAMAIAERIPPARYGTIEIRPLMEIEGLVGQKPARAEI